MTKNKTDKKIEAVRTLMPEVKHPELFTSDERVRYFRGRECSKDGELVSKTDCGRFDSYPVRHRMKKIWSKFERTGVESGVLYFKANPNEDYYLSLEEKHRMYAPLWKEIIWAIKETKLYNYLKGKL